MQSTVQRNRGRYILMLGVAGIAALAGGSLTVGDLANKKELVYAVFSGAIPVVCAFVLLVWVSEAVRCHRVGYHLAAETEARINALLGRLSMTWEASLWTGFYSRDEKLGPSMMALALIGILAGAAPLCGLWLSDTPLDPLWVPLLILGLPYGLLLLVVAYVARQMPRLVNIPEVRSKIAAAPPR